MDCFRCGSPVVGNIGRCTRCGQNLSAYKKAVWASNVYYNMGLERAKGNDLSGAVIFLRQSLGLNKMNIEARNLLGLIYYQMGEVADGQRQWFISRSLSVRDNPAANYLAQLRIHKGKHEYYAKAVEKYNQALEYCKAGNKDVALLQAKKVVGMNPGYVKAYLLLALLYMDKGEYTKAEKTLKRLLKFDCANATAFRYLAEIKQVSGRRTLFPVLRFNKKSKPQDDPFDPSHVTDEPIIPTYTEISDNWHAVALLLFGLVAGALFFAYLIIPSVKTAMNSDFNESLVAYNESIAAKDGEITSLENNAIVLQSNIDALKEELGFYNSDSGVLSSYNQMLDVLVLLRNGDYLGAMNVMGGVDAEHITNEKFQEIYNNISEEFDVNGVATLFNMGVTFYDAGDFETARSYFEKCVSIQPDYPEAILRLGFAIVNLGDQETANTYFTQLVDNYPGTEFASQAMVARGY